MPYTDDKSDPQQTMYLSCPDGVKDFPTIVWFHGGGLTGGGREIPGELYDGNSAVVEARYRLSPGVRTPAHHQDAAAAVAWVFKNIAPYGGDPGKIFVGGMSAGCYLAAMVGMNPEFLAAHGISSKDLRGLLLVSGQMTTHFQVKLDLGYPGENLIPAVDKYAPMAFISKDVPPVICVTGQPDLDMPGRAHENALMIDLLKALGHRKAEHYSLPGHGHGDVLDSCDLLLKRFIAETLKG